jgi:Macrocin-O-methyltransferase (TylF)
MSTNPIKTLATAPQQERQQRTALMNLLQKTPIPPAELDSNVGLYCTRQAMSRILYMHDLYRQIVDVHGVIMEFGVRWGHNLALFSSFRGIYEPYNYSRKIVGFDTFGGFPSVAGEDGAAVATGDYSVITGYETHLTEVLDIHQSLSPLPHIPKYELVKGDAMKTVPAYLERNPHTIVALACFDFDLYAPTKACLEVILPRVPKGGIIAFDELNHPQFPGETTAVLETIGLQKYRLHRSPLNPFCCYVKVE